MPNNKSQLGQDKYVLEFYKHKRNGFFLDIGASDGVLLSNTYLLEKDYDWTGICVEPIPDNFKKLVKERPRSLCCDKPVYSTTGLGVTFHIAHSDDLLSGISDHIDCHKKKVDKEKTTIRLHTISLNDLLREYNAPEYIDYMSLDTEGSEYEILKSCDFDKYSFGLIDVEHNFIEPRRTQIRQLLESKGYIYDGENKWDDRYIKG